MLLNYARCERVFMLDCDEWASWLELDTLHDVPRTIDAVSFVRINPLVQRTAEMPQNVNEYNWQNFPDRQMRFFDAKLRYSGKLHEGNTRRSERACIEYSSYPRQRYRQSERARFILPFFSAFEIIFLYLSVDFFFS